MHLCTNIQYFPHIIFNSGCLIFVPCRAELHFESLCLREVSTLRVSFLIMLLTLTMWTLTAGIIQAFVGKIRMGMKWGILMIRIIRCMLVWWYSDGNKVASCPHLRSTLYIMALENDVKSVEFLLNHGTSRIPQRWALFGWNLNIDIDIEAEEISPISSSSSISS